MLRIISWNRTISKKTSPKTYLQEKHTLLGRYRESGRAPKKMRVLVSFPHASGLQHGQASACRRLYNTDIASMLKVKSTLEFVQVTEGAVGSL